jgi:8-oxo-dGTP pyrophosphatase MutT (NUDIX family)
MTPRLLPWISLMPFTNEDHTPPTLRRAARLLIVDPLTHAVLLFQYQDAGRTWWATPGGGLEADETFEAAAVREATEELAIASENLVPLWQRTVEFSFRGAPIRQHEQYFLIKMSSDQIALGSTVRDAHAREGILAARWWSLDEIGTTAEQIFPEDLCERLRRVT